MRSFIYLIVNKCHGYQMPLVDRLDLSLATTGHRTWWWDVLDSLLFLPKVLLEDCQDVFVELALLGAKVDKASNILGLVSTKSLHDTPTTPETFSSCWSDACAARM